MSNRLLRNLSWVPALAITLFFSTNLSAATFTAIASGNWSSSATWAGGTSPGSTLSAGDNVVIAAAFNVNLDQSVTLNGALSSLQVDGSLSTSNSSDLMVTQGTLLGAGNVMVDELTLGTLAAVTYTGNLTANSFTSAATSISLALHLTVNQTLNLTGGLLNFGTGAALALQNNSTIRVNGGSLGTSGTGTLGLTGTYNVVYNGSSTVSGLELNGTGLNNVTVSLSSSTQMLNLSNNTTISGMLSLQGGQLNTNGNDLTLNGGFMTSGSGTITGSNGSDLTLGGSTGGSLAFTTGSQTVNNLTISLPSSAVVELNSNLTVSGGFSNSSGTLDTSDVNLTLSGNITGSGTLVSNSNSSLILNGSGSLTGMLNLATTGASTGSLGNLTVALTGGGTISLGDDATITNTLTLTSGSLAINGNELTISGNISASGSGTLVGSSSSVLTIMTSGSVAGNLTFSGTGSAQTLDELNIDLASNGTIRLGSNLTINGALNLDGGNLNLNGNSITVGAGTDITLNGGASVLGTGNFNGGAGFNLTVTGTGNVSTGVFGTGNGLGNLTIDFDDTTSTLTIGNDITVNGTLDLQGGNLDLDGYDLTLNGNISGGVTGHIVSDGNSSITVNGSTSTTGGLNFSSTGNTVGSLTVNLTNNGSVSINSDLTIEDDLNFTSGMVILHDGDLMIASGGTITGAGLNNYVVTSGQGSLMLDVASTTTSTFAVGTSSTYTPAEITLNSTTSGMFGVRVAEGVWSQGTTGSNLATSNSVVNATWFVESDVTASLDMDLQVEWTSAMEVNGFNRDSAALRHFVSGSWDATTNASANVEATGRYSIVREGITSLSPFAVFDKNASTVGIREITAVEDLNVYPNPAINVVTIPANDNASTVKIIDLNGATVIELSREAFQASTIDVATLSNGMYLVKVIGNNSVSTGRFVKN
ncbi:hypothetical protein BH09BAC1_BH09BAC1_17080 [soil metagenome]